MIGLVSVFLFAGYTLVYAAVANGGRFAATPWEALRQDAYQGGQAGHSAAAAGGSGGIGGAAGFIWGLATKVGGFLP